MGCSPQFITMKFAVACITGASAASLADIAAEVNAKATTWTAQAPDNFADTEDVKAYLGAFLPGDAEFTEDPVKEDIFTNFEAPASFDSIDQWPQCSLITNVRGDYSDTKGDTCSRYSLKACAHHVPADAKYPACPSSEYNSPSCPTSCETSSRSFSSDKMYAASTYSVRGEANIMAELAQNGPMYVSFTVYGDFPTYKSGVYKSTSSQYLGGHAVTMVGYGTLNGEKYWKIKNSWNENWGNNGHFLIARGTNECGIEGNVGAGTIQTSAVV